LLAGTEKGVDFVFMVVLLYMSLLRTYLPSHLGEEQPTGNQGDEEEVGISHMDSMSKGRIILCGKRIRSLWDEINYAHVRAL
jgi:hypothetical protein